MNQTSQVIGLLWSCLFSLTLVDCNRFNKSEINEVRIEWTFKRIQE